MRTPTPYVKPPVMAASFDGSAYLDSVQGITAVNSSEGILSCFVKRQTGDKGLLCELVQSQGVLVLRVGIHETLHYAFIDLRIGTGTLFACSAPNALPIDGRWHHLLISWNTNRPAGQKLLDLYIDDHAALSRKDDSYAAFTPLTSSKHWRMGGSITSPAQTFCGMLAQYRLELGRSIDASVTANRRAYNNPYGKPLRSHGASTAQLDLRFEGSTAEKNSGTAPDFTRVGNLLLTRADI